MKITQLSLFFVLGIGSCTLWSQEEASPSKGATTTEEQLKLQIFLDKNQFRPGKLDGHQGEFTDKALQRLSESSAMDAGALREKALLPASEPYGEYTVRDEDFKFVSPLPATPEEKSKLKFLAYASVAEMIAERFHCDLDYLHILNKGVDFDKLKAGTVLKVPSVEPFLIESIWKDDGKSADDAGKDTKSSFLPADRSVRISRSEHVLEVREGDHLLASFPVSVGPPENETPPGLHKITKISPRPNFRYDEKMLKEGVRGDEAWLLPPGPNSPVGVMWVALSKDGIGIHGTDNPDMIGRNISSGCIRLSNWDVVTFAKMVGTGTPVTIE